MIELIIAGILLFAASYTDIRTREVPDWMSYTGMGFGFALAIFNAWQFSSWSYMINSAVGFALAGAVGGALYYAGQWGGGDAKILMALGSIFGFELKTNTFLLSFMTNLVFAGALYGMCAIFILMILKWKIVKPNLLKTFENLYTWLAIFISLLVSGFVIISSRIIDFDLLSSIIIAVSIPLLTLLAILAYVVQNSAFKFKVPVPKLTLGDWLAEPVIVKGRIACGASKTGLNEAQIAKLKLLHKKKQVKNVMIKSGIPFIPPFLIAYIITAIFGNILLFVKF